MKDAIKLIGLDLDIDEQSAHEVCPFCKGGSSHERSFRVKRVRNGLLYQCYRASCNERGFVPSLSFSNKEIKKDDKLSNKRTMPYLYDTIEVPPEYLELFYNNFELTEEDVVQQGWKYSPERDTIIQPIYNYLGYEVGINDRSYSGRKPKSIFYYHNPRCTQLAYCRVYDNPYAKAIVLTEDQVSAIKVNKIMNAVSSLGTYLHPSAIVELRNQYDNIIIWWDEDAIDKANSLAKKIGLVFDSVQVVYTQDDPKDTPLTKIREVLWNRS